MKSGSKVDDPPAFLPPRRRSLPNLTRSGLTWRIDDDVPPLPPAARAAPFIPQQCRPSSSRTSSPARGRASSGSNRAATSQFVEDTHSRPTSFQSYSSGDTVLFSEPSLYRSASNGSRRRTRNGIESPARTPKLEPIRDNEPLRTKPHLARRFPGELGVVRQSSLRNETRLSDDLLGPPLLPPPALATSHSDPQITRSGASRPFSYPSVQSDKHIQAAQSQQQYLEPEDPWKLPPLPPPSRSSSQGSRRLTGRPRASFSRLSSLDNLITYREEKAEWKRASSVLVPSDSPQSAARNEKTKSFHEIPDPSSTAESEVSDEPVDTEQQSMLTTQTKKAKFRHFAAEVGFCFTIAMTQFLAEYLISGFAIELPSLLKEHIEIGPSSMGMFWPASLLSLILSATLLFFARLSDMYSGYLIFMSGVGWLAIWTLIPGFCKSLIWIDVSRAMQGLAIAAFMPSTFSMVGSIYPEGPRKNFVLGLYSGCAPLGFFAGFLVAGALPEDKASWYWFVAAALSLITFITAFMSVPSDRTDRRKLGLKMDWMGAFLIMAGLILVSYALAVEPFANQFKVDKPGFAFPIVIGPFASGIACLAIAFWYEGWCAKCPLLPFEFFKPKSVKAFSVACMCFYASYGVWLYNSAQFFELPSVRPFEPMTGLTLALWYTPTAIGGIILCIIGGLVIHVVPIMILLLISALAWIGAPLLLALAPLPLHYWEYVVPSMLCATIGIDLTFTVSIVFFSSVQPLRYQGLSGAVCSILVNLAMSFALSISEIVMERASKVPRTGPEASAWGFTATFIYAAASAGLGLLICVMFVRISRSVVREQPGDQERGPNRSSDTTLVDPEEHQEDDEHRTESITDRSNAD